MEIAIFYCQRHLERMKEIGKFLDGPEGPSLRQVALPCSGKLEISFLLKALEEGAEGVAVLGCPEEECRYLVGSRRARGRVGQARQILRQIGLEEDRVSRFVLQTDGREAFSQWVEKIKAMGKLGKRTLRS